MSCYGCKCDHCVYNVELESWYMTPDEVQNVDDLCFCCDECKHFDGDFIRKRSQYRAECEKYRPPKKYQEQITAASEREAKRRRAMFRVIAGKRPEEGSEAKQ